MIARCHRASPFSMQKKKEEEEGKLYLYNLFFFEITVQGKVFLHFPAPVTVHPRSELVIIFEITL